jgi:hypothetical protein
MDSWNPRWIRSAPLRPLVPSVGLLGGLILGAAWEHLQGHPFEAKLLGALQLGLVGSVLGMAVLLADGFGRDRAGRFSTRGWMIIVAVAAFAFALLASVLRA